MSLRRIFLSAACELAGAVRTRRALVVLALYFAASLLSMGGSITLLGKVERQVTETLHLDASESGRDGAVSAALWKSRQFQQIVRGALSDSLVYDDICGKHPAELLYAWFAFLYVPLLTILVGANRVADDLRSGSVRYMITRMTRLEWSLGKYAGLALMLAAGLFVGGFAGWGVAAVKLGGADIAALLPSILLWSAKAWFLSLAWLGFSLGVSHLFHSGAKATAVCLVLFVAGSIATAILNALVDRGAAAGWMAVLGRLYPGELDEGLWRSSFLPVATSAVNLAALGLMYLSAGYLHFSRRDAR